MEGLTLRHTVAGGSLVAAEWPKSTEFAGDPRRRKGVVGLDAALPGSVWSTKRKQGTAVVRSSTETRRGATLVARSTKAMMVEASGVCRGANNGARGGRGGG